MHIIFALATNHTNCMLYVFARLNGKCGITIQKESIECKNLKRQDRPSIVFTWIFYNYASSFLFSAVPDFLQTEQKVVQPYLRDNLSRLNFDFQYKVFSFTSLQATHHRTETVIHTFMHLNLRYLQIQNSRQHALGSQHFSVTFPVSPQFIHIFRFTIRTVKFNPLSSPVVLFYYSLYIAHQKHTNLKTWQVVSIS